MSTVGWIHFIGALLAMAVGTVVVLMKPKGGKRHKQLGIVFAVSMLVVNGTAFMIYGLFGGFGPFHFFATVNLIGTVLGWRAIYQARAARAKGQMFLRARLIEIHYYWITWSYVGLLAAAASEAITRLPAFHFVRAGGLSFGIGVAVATAIVIGTGAFIIHGRGRRALAPFKVAAPEANAAPE